MTAEIRQQLEKRLRAFVLQEVENGALAAEVIEDFLVENFDKQQLAEMLAVHEAREILKANQ
ncbi:hypothetical protein [Aeoliella sp.]|uniref:hypothetical protein n=1 Tax=Aeoliella sp. TaxID=2795800 RepID=UPI003CCC370D